MKKLIGMLALAAATLAAPDSHAWFKICNTKTNGAAMWVTYASYIPSTTTIYTDACGSASSVFSPQYYTTWRNRGWWYLTQNQCATVNGAALNNRYQYVYAQVSDGSTLIGANSYSFQVASSAFTLDQYTGGPHGSCGGECIGSVSYGHCANPQPSYWYVNTLEVDSGNASNYTLSIN
ncbi:MAG TPA: DUF1036 domain-containing protein [Polyangiaceae bacterium]|nr:DUF1036 domain-containing protein [Polyangiaceae bacterium]